MKQDFEIGINFHKRHYPSAKCKEFPLNVVHGKPVKAELDAAIGELVTEHAENYGSQEVHVWVNVQYQGTRAVVVVPPKEKT